MINPDKGLVKVTGHLNWYILLLIIFLIKLVVMAYLQQDYIKVFFAILLMVLGLIYDYQAGRFRQIADLVAKNLEKLELTN